MKVLESSPSRYDRGIQYLTFGKIKKIYTKLVSHVKKEDLVLDLGCGTGFLSLLAAKRGARVKGIDINPDMLEIAKKRKNEMELENQILFEERGVAELDSEEGPYDIIMSGMLFSELQPYERKFTINQVIRLLKPGGLFLIADEIIPYNPFKRIISWIIRMPLLVITYILTQTNTSAVKNLDKLIIDSGLQIIEKDHYMFDSFITIVGRKK